MEIDTKVAGTSERDELGIADAPEGHGNVSTRDRLLRTGARLFAEQGFHAVSVRSIVADADVNLGAINYHFGSKQALFEEIFAAGASRITQMRLHLLANCHDGPDRPPLLEQVLTAYLAPGLIYGAERADIAEFQRIRARIVTEDSALARRLLRRHFQQSTEHFTEMLSRSLPDVPRNLLLWRYQTLIATVVYAGSSWGTIHSAPGERGAADDAQALDYLVPLMAAMFRTPACDQPTDAMGVLKSLMES